MCAETSHIEHGLVHLETLSWYGFISQTRRKERFRLPLNEGLCFNTGGSVPVKPLPVFFHLKCTTWDNKRSQSKPEPVSVLQTSLFGKCYKTRLGSGLSANLHGLRIPNGDAGHKVCNGFEPSIFIRQSTSEHRLNARLCLCETLL